MITPDTPAEAYRRTEETYREQFAVSVADLTVPPGFARFHSEGFSTYLGWTPGEFDGKRILDTGAGAGKHAAVLAMLGADVTAVDLLRVNADAIERLAAANGLARLRARQVDLMLPLPADLGTFDAVTAHNWLMHSADPAVVLLNMAAALRPGGRLYLSLYQSGSFRFFVAQIARQVLRWEDRPLVQQMIPLQFPEGFDEFGVPEHISFENILDDDFVPFMWTFRWEPLMRFLREAGFEVLVPHQGQAMRHRVDKETLKASFVKVRDITPPLSSLELSGDEFVPPQGLSSEEHDLLERSAELARAATRKLQQSGAGEGPIRAAFALALYRIRARHCLEKDAVRRHLALQAFLERFLTGDNRAIRAYESSRRVYEGARDVWEIVP